MRMVPKKAARERCPRRTCKDPGVGYLPTLLVLVGVVVLVATGVLSAAGVGFILLIGGVTMGLAHWSDRWRTP